MGGGVRITSERNNQNYEICSAVKSSSVPKLIKCVIIIIIIIIKLGIKYTHFLYN